MKHTLISFCTLFLAVAAWAQDSLPDKIINYGFPEEYEIGGITVTGTQFLDENILIAVSGLTVGERITIPGEDITKAMKALWKQGLFANVKIYITKTVGDKAFLEIQLEERPRLGGFKIRGVRKSEHDEIRDEIKLTKGRVVTDNMKITAVNKIRDYYQDKGFLDASIKVHEVPDTSSTNRVTLIFDIKRGEKVKIEDVIIVGNDNIKDYKLKRLMKNTKEKARFQPITKADWQLLKSDSSPLKKPFKPLGNISPIGIYYSMGKRIRPKIFTASRFLEENLEDDKIKVVEYYNTKGYRDAAIIKDSVYRAETGDLNVVLHIKEGRKYYFREINFAGNSKYEDDKLHKILNIKRGMVYDQSLLDQRLFMNPDGGDISSLYMDDGYLFFQVTPIEKKVEGDSIDLEIRIYEGPQAIIDQVTIAGNTRTNEHVIRRELYTLPGNKFSRSDIIRSQREIANLGFFDAEKIQINPIPHPEKGTVDIEYRVEERPSDQVELSAGWGGPTGIIGTLGLTFNNFSTQNIFKRGEWGGYLPTGDGQKLSIRGQANQWFNSMNASFTEPWLGGNKPNSMTISAYRSVQSNGILAKDATDARPRRDLTTIGGSIGFGFRLRWPDNYFSVQTALNFQNFNNNNLYSFSSLFTSGEANNLNASLTIARNSLDQPLYPRYGSSLSLTIQATPPYSFFNNIDYATATQQERYRWLEYHKWRFDAEWYTRVKGDLVFKARAKVGFLGKYQPIVGTSPFERFELGGDGISNFSLYGKDIIALRGYEVFEVMKGNNDGAPIFNKFSMELRYPFVLKPMSTIYGLAFVEGGNAWNKFSEYNPFELKRSAGLGIRIFLPMFGLLGFDYGIGFDKGLPKGSGLGEYGKINIILGFEPQ